jgi:hypothetical protein
LFKRATRICVAPGIESTACASVPAAPGAPTSTAWPAAKPAELATDRLTAPALGPAAAESVVAWLGAPGVFPPPRRSALITP